jgi:hypothetical protein
MRSGLAAACALALGCCIFSSHAVAQISASSDASPEKKTAANTANPKKTVNAASHSSAAKTTTSSGKAHAVPHHAVGAHPKSNAAVASHNSKSTRASLRKNGKRKTAARGQQKIDSERAEAIQEALIREHYMSGEPAGTWNEASEAAMRRYQADHGWQSKTVPDSRALISLGLGPSHDRLLNPESAMTTGPESPRASSLIPASHSADPGAPASANPTSTAPATSPTSVPQ